MGFGLYFYYNFNTYTSYCSCRWSYLYFVAWWLISVIIVLNLFTALIMEVMCSSQSCWLHTPVFALLQLRTQQNRFQAKRLSNQIIIKNLHSSSLYKAQQWKNIIWLIWKKCTLCIMINNKGLFDLIAWPLTEKKKEKEEKDVRAKNKTKTGGKGGNVSNQSREWHYI